jgi:pimeloyl-ACP methyl ester carboxylesterase
LPLKFYLQRERISDDPAFWAATWRDPLVLRGYSLYFLASLFTTVFPGLTNGNIRCPVYLITDTNDQLFTMDNTRLVFDHLRAPHKELIELDLGGHMFMATHPREVCEALSPKMREALAIADAGNIEGDI